MTVNMRNPGAPASASGVEVGLRKSDIPNRYKISAFPATRVCAEVLRASRLIRLHGLTRHQAALVASLAYGEVRP